MPTEHTNSVTDAVDLDNWFDSWSEGPFSLREVESMVESHGSPHEFHTVEWDGKRRITYADYLERRARK